MHYASSISLHEQSRRDTIDLHFGLYAQLTYPPWRLQIVQEIEATACGFETEEHGILGFSTSSQNLL